MKRQLNNNFKWSNFNADKNKRNCKQPGNKIHV